MKDSPYSHPVCVWLLAVTVLAGTVFALAAPAAAVPAGEADHLKCFNIIDDNTPDGRTTIDALYSRELGTEYGCYIFHTARSLCAPAMKFPIAGSSGDDPRAGALSTLYTCYQLVCPDDPVRTLHVDDQFQRRRITIRQARWLCAPVAGVSSN